VGNHTYKYLANHPTHVNDLGKDDYSKRGASASKR